MPTCEEILELPPEGWEAIGKMNDEELCIYLKDITILEPVIPESSEPNRVFDKKKKELEEEMEEVGEVNNPFKSKSKKKVSKTGKSKMSDAEKDALMNSLLEGIE